MKNKETPKEHQLKFYRKHKDDVSHLLDVSRKYIEILRLKENLASCESVIDVGCGPVGGIFSVMKFPVMVGIDPYWEEYSSMYE